MSVRHRVFCSVAAVVLCQSSCSRKPAPVYVPGDFQAQGLPGDPKKLISIADKLHKTDQKDVKQVERGLAALERLRAVEGPTYQAMWRIARGRYLLCERDAARVKENATGGMAAAQAAIDEEPDRVEGHYYSALNMGKLAELDSKLSLIKPMVAAAERASKIDPSYEAAGALVFLGKVHLTAPIWPVSVGNVEKSIEYLERALELAPRPLTRVFLGQAYAEDDRYEEAVRELELALAEAGDSGLDPKWRAEAEASLEDAKSEL